MAFKFYESSCVIAGTFNIYIIRPDWLGAIGLIPKGSEVQFSFETQLSQPGFRLSSPNLGSRWTVLPNRLILETNEPNENCGETADKILESLPWTPLVGLGCNFAYRGDPSAVPGWDEKTKFPSSQVSDGYELSQRTWQIGVKHDELVFNLHISELEDCVEIRANVHTDLQNRDIEFARETAKQFFKLRQTSHSLFRDIFNAEVENDIDDQ